MAKRKSKAKPARKAKAAPEFASPKDFGKRLEPPVSRQAVMKALEAGRLDSSASKTDRGWWLIDVATGLEEWAAWTDHSKAEGGKAKKGGRPRGASSPARPPTTEGLFPEDDEEEHARQKTHAQASTTRILVDAELKQLELDSKRGNLVDRHQVQREAYQLARVVRDRILMIPDRIAAELAGVTDPGDVHRRLLEELLASLASLADEVEGVENSSALMG